MKKVARRVGVATDTSRNWELTNWDAVTQFAEAYAGFLPVGTPPVAVAEHVAG
jgi:hypothetical protein